MTTYFLRTYAASILHVPGHQPTRASTPPTAAACAPTYVHDLRDLLPSPDGRHSKSVAGVNRSSPSSQVGTHAQVVDTGSSRHCRSLPSVPVGFASAGEQVRVGWAQQQRIASFRISTLHLRRPVLYYVRRWHGNFISCSVRRRQGRHWIDIRRPLVAYHLFQIKGSSPRLAKGKRVSEGWSEWRR